MKKAPLLITAAVLVVLGGAFGLWRVMSDDESGKEARVKGAFASTVCEVLPLTTEHTTVGGKPAMVWARAQYRCNRGNPPYTLKVWLVWNGVVQPGYSYSVGARSTWSSVYLSPKKNCSFGGYYRSRVQLVVDGAIDPGPDLGMSYKECG